MASAYNTGVYRNKTRSFLGMGNHNQEQRGIGGTKEYAMFGGGKFEFKTTIRAAADQLRTTTRAAGDRQVDLEKQWRAQEGYGVFKRPDDYTLRLGNVSGYFGSYSLSSSANVGAHLTKTLGGHIPFKEMQIYLARPNRHLEGTSFERQVHGMRMSELKKEGWEAMPMLGMSYVRTLDLVDSIKDTNARPTNAVENNVLAMDGTYKFSDDMTVSGEWAYSKNDPNTQRDLTDIRRGQAYKLNGTYRAASRPGFEATNFTGAFEEVAPDFRAASGGGSPDARRASGGVTTKMKMYSKVPDVQMSYNYSRNLNNLEGQLARRTTSQVHGVNMGFKPFQKMKFEKAKLWQNIQKNLNIATSFGENIRHTTDRSSLSQINNQNYRMSTSSGNHTLSTFYRYRITQEKTAATGDRRNASQGITYVYNGMEWTMPLYPQKPFKTDWTLTGTQTRDKTIDAPGRSHQRQYGARMQTAVTARAHLDVDYNLDLTDNYNVNSDIRTTNWKCAYVVEKSINDDGNLTLTYTSNNREKEVSSQNYREGVWRADINFKWGESAPEMLAQRGELESAVKAILDAFEGEDPLAFMKVVSKDFKGNQIEFENNVLAQFDRVDNIRYDGVWVNNFVPGDAASEVTFRWQRRWLVYATGAEETTTGVALFRLEKSSGQWLLQEIREISPFF